MATQDTARRHPQNIRIIAFHVDAGKTTTTERILYYTGRKHTIVDVHDTKDLKMSTTTDYLEQEQKRGITIQSAAVSAFWRTRSSTSSTPPGHVDFTIEVNRFTACSTARSSCSTAWRASNRSPTNWRLADNYRFRAWCCDQQDGPQRVPFHALRRHDQEAPRRRRWSRTCRSAPRTTSRAWSTWSQKQGLPPGTPETATRGRSTSSTAARWTSSGITVKSDRERSRFGREVPHQPRTPRSSRTTRRWRPSSMRRRSLGRDAEEIASARARSTAVHRRAVRLLAF